MNTDTPNISEKWMRRVAAMLAKAESTDSADEAAAFFAKAQEIIAQHGIDERDLATAGARHNGDTMGAENVDVPDPYAIPKSVILAAISGHNGVLTYRTTGRDKVFTIAGREGDRAIVKAMFASVVATAERLLAQTDVPPWESARTFRRSFYLGFANEIHDRLEKANETVGDGSAALVVADRVADARDYVNGTLDSGGRLRTARSSSSSTAGHLAGRDAAARANLGASVGSGQRRALGA